VSGLSPGDIGNRERAARTLTPPLIELEPRLGQAKKDASLLLVAVRRRHDEGLESVLAGTRIRHRTNLDT
jgi:hypothetical protein